MWHGRTAGQRRTAGPIWLALLCLLLGCSHALAAGSHLERFLKRLEPGQLVPGADGFGAATGDPPVVPVLRAGSVVGHAFLNADFVNAAGYSGKPIYVLIALDSDARITGLRMVDHKEPIVLVGIPEGEIHAFNDAYIGFDVASFARSEGVGHEVDVVSGATVTVMVIDDSILRSALRVARRLGLGGLQPKQLRAAGPRWRVDPDLMLLSDWQTLLGEGAVRHLQLSVGDINQAFAESGDAAAAARPEVGPEDDDFIDLYTAVVSIPSIGRSLLGADEFANLQAALQPGQSAILLAAKGRYSFKGSGYVRGGIFDRIQIIQGDESYRFRDKNHKRLGSLAAEAAPRLSEVDLFVIPSDRSFDAAAPWRVELLVQRPVGPTKKAFLTFDLGYKPPQRYLIKLEEPAAPPAPASSADSESEQAGPALWQRIWWSKRIEVAILLLGLATLTVIFFIQDWLTKRPRLTAGLRTGFLIFTLFGIGFYANAQLSVVNLMTFFNALVTGFSWESFLIEPLIFILWCSVAASLLFWGRGAFCGWLCPFGALQELTNRLARLARVPQVAVPWWLHQRLWPIKYMVFLGLFGLSLYSLAWAEQLAEIEPFKTAIVLKFQRHWPFVLFALLLLAAGLFIERFYCRYLCPLGAALAIPGRLRMFDWLVRYRECGSPCQRCAGECMVGAIHPEGQINPNECLSCLHCQTLYHNDRRCPVMIQRRLKRERREALASKTRPGGKPKGPPRQPELADFLPD